MRFAVVTAFDVPAGVTGAQVWEALNDWPPFRTAAATVTGQRGQVHQPVKLPPGEIAPAGIVVPWRDLLAPSKSSVYLSASLKRRIHEAAGRANLSQSAWISRACERYLSEEDRA